MMRGITVAMLLHKATYGKSGKTRKVQGNDLS